MILKDYNKIFESEHYLFHFKNNSLAQKDIPNIAINQELCYKKITNLLKIYPEFKINYYLIETPEEVGKIYSQLHNDDDDEPCNGFTDFPDTIYCVYNDSIKCIGMHEDTHIISYSKFRPQSAFMREGLAMYMDKFWHGKLNEKCVYDILNDNFEINFYKLFNNEYFFKIDTNISYPLAGSFVNFIISNFGIETFLYQLYYSKEDYTTQLDKLLQYRKNHLTPMFIDFIKNKASN